MAEPNTSPDTTETGRSRLVPPRDLITGGFSKNADFLSYILAGLLIGLLLDWVFGTSPVLLVVFAVIGIAVGFYRLWQASAELEEQAKGRGHGV